MSKSLSTRVSHFVAEGRYHQQIVDTSGPAPRVISGYSYPLPTRRGQVDDLPGYPMEERSRCYVRNHRTNSTVNGVCLDCLQSRGRINRSRKHA